MKCACGKEADANHLMHGRCHRCYLRIISEETEKRRQVSMRRMHEPSRYDDR